VPQQPNQQPLSVKTNGSDGQSKHPFPNFA
jgi:hypothetical protein